MFDVVEPASCIFILQTLHLAIQCFVLKISEYPCQISPSSKSCMSFLDWSVENILGNLKDIERPLSVSSAALSSLCVQ